MPLPHGTALLMAALLIVGGCSGEHEAEMSQAAAPATASTPPAVASAPVSGPTSLSLLRPKGSRCEWQRLSLPKREIRVIASFEGNCAGAQLAISPDQSKALILVDPQWRNGGYSAPGMTQPYAKEIPAGEGPMRLYEVAVETGAVTVLDLPTNGSPRDIGYNRQNTAVILTLEDVEDPTEARTALVFEGQRLPIPDDGEGIPALAHGFELVGNAWRRVETRATRVGADYSLGAAALRLNANRSSSSAEILSPHPDGDAIADPAVLIKLKAQAPHLTPDNGGDGQWLKLKGVDALVWEVAIEFVYSTGAVRFLAGDALLEPPGLGFTDGDLIAPVVRDRLLLITQAATGAYPRLYDTKTRTLLYSSDDAVATTFWPS